MNNKKVLVIDDEDFIRDLVRDFLDLKNIECDDASNAIQALELYSANYYDLVLLDVNLGKHKADEVVAQLRSVKDGTPIVLLTGDQQYNIEFAEQIGADGVLFKPFQVDNFINNIKKFLER